jgi:hypothetical protein
MMADLSETEHLRRIAEAARRFVQIGSRITRIDGEFVHQIIENDDKSDPHYALCQAVIEYDEQVSA